MEEITPSSILQRMYLKKRLKQGSYKTFCEIGCGNGHLSTLLLQNNLTGSGFEFSEESCKNNVKKNDQYIREGKYKIIGGDFFTNSEAAEEKKYGIIIPFMIIEQLSPEDVRKYFSKCKNLLAQKGRVNVSVPASMKYLSGIEDEIAGHYKRYDFNDFKNISKVHSFIITDLCRLTYPISNWLFSLSNFMVKKHESSKLNLGMQYRTILSCNRDIKYKTSFPLLLKIILNEFVLSPFYILQRIFKNHSYSMIMCCEFV